MAEVEEKKEEVKEEKKGEEAEITIVDIRDVPATEPGRIGKLDVLVTYQIDPAHVYMIRIPKEEFSEEALREAIRKDIEEKRKWIGKVMKV